LFHGAKNVEHKISTKQAKQKAISKDTNVKNAVIDLYGPLTYLEAELSTGVSPVVT